MKKIDWIILLAIPIISLFVLKDLFKPGMYTSHDGIHNVVRFYYFDQVLRDGQIPPRFVSGLLNGFGYPLFIFSYHLPWYIAELIHILGATIITSVKMTFLVGFAASGITMYLFQKEIFGRLPGLVGTVIYLFAPYRFSNIFVRAAIGDATAFIFPPLLFLSITKLREEKSKIWFWIVCGGISLAGLILSHAMVFLFFFAFFVGFSLYSLLVVNNKWKFLSRVISMILLGFGFSAYYFIPSILERNFTKFKEIMGGAFNGSTFLTLKELIYSPWGYGTMRSYEGGMSFQIGFAQWLSFLLAAILIIYTLIIRKNIKKTKKDLLNYDMLFFAIFFILSIFMILPQSFPIWKFINSVAFVDFTWRILALIVFIAAILGGFVIYKVNWKIITAGFLVFLAIYANRNHTRINQSLDWPLDFMLKLEKTTNSFSEYTPRWARNELLEKPLPKVEFSTPANINIDKQNSDELTFTLQSAQKGLARINTVYYPGWEIYVDGKKQTTDYNSGFMEFPIDKNDIKVTAKFNNTPLRNISDMISLSSIGLAIYLLIKGRFKKFRFTYPK